MTEVAAPPAKAERRRVESAPHGASDYLAFQRYLERAPEAADAALIRQYISEGKSS